CCETSTFGVRVSPLSRRKVAREVVRVTTRFGGVRGTVGIAPDILQTDPEYDDCRWAAELSGAAHPRGLRRGDRSVPVAVRAVVTGGGRQRRPFLDGRRFGSIQYRSADATTRNRAAS
ncbi:DUF111 family protein, partial [Candidatus Poribacteria bacterium]|nr:DUF111 family protein [Candidatus Poribacteria bacterium]